MKWVMYKNARGVVLNSARAKGYVVGFLAITSEHVIVQLGDGSTVILHKNEISRTYCGPYETCVADMVAAVAGFAL